MKTIALVAHDAKKDDLLKWVTEHADKLVGNNFYAKWQLENRDRMPNVELPPEAFAGDKKQ